MKTSKRPAKSFYAEMTKSSAFQKAPFSRQDFKLYESIRYLRESKKLSGVEVCQAGGIDPKTLNAVEKGRIKNPSIQTLQSIASGLGVSVSDLFRHAEMTLPLRFYRGTQKGVYHMEFSQLGVRVVSFTPLMRDFFCGKFIFGGKKKIEGELYHHPAPIYISCLMGKFEIRVESHTEILQEGDNLFFYGGFRHAFHNLQQRDAALLFMTAPSFLGG